MEEYREVFEACKHALTTIGVKGKDSIDRLLGCILLLQDTDMTKEKVQGILSSLDNISVGGEENLRLMLDVILLLEGVRDGTIRLSKKEVDSIDSEIIEEEDDG